MSQQNLQTTPRILMLRPHRFLFNEETMLSNAFQQRNESSEQEQIIEKASAEFDAMVEKLRAHGVDVIVKQDTPSPPKPDAIFPNNWVMFHHSGAVSLFPMEAKNRRNERRMDLIEDLKEDFIVTEIHDFSPAERDGKYLEGTGSMIFDHPNRIAYACLSTRTHPELFAKFCNEMNYEGQAFHAYDEKDQPIYHTNVIMSLGEKLAVLCTEAIKAEDEKERIISRLHKTGHELVDISFFQTQRFAGNMLELKNPSGKNFMVMSSRAFESLEEDQLKAITKHTEIIHSPLTTIEDIGGGSARCMMAEIFLPQKSSGDF